MPAGLERDGGARSRDALLNEEVARDGNPAEGGRAEGPPNEPALPVDAQRCEIGGPSPISDVYRVAPGGVSRENPGLPAEEDIEECLDVAASAGLCLPDRGLGADGGDREGHPAVGPEADGGGAVGQPPNQRVVTPAGRLAGGEGDQRELAQDREVERGGWAGRWRPAGAGGLVDCTVAVVVEAVSAHLGGGRAGDGAALQVVPDRGADEPARALALAGSLVTGGSEVGVGGAVVSAAAVPRAPGVAAGGGASAGGYLADRAGVRLNADPDAVALAHPAGGVQRGVIRAIVWRGRGPASIAGPGGVAGQWWPPVSSTPPAAGTTVGGGAG